jgi:hypothetical protein
MVGSSPEDIVALGAGRAGVLAALVAFALALAVVPSVLAGAFLIGAPAAGSTPESVLGPILQSLNVVRLAAAAGLVFMLPLLRGER